MSDEVDPDRDSVDKSESNIEDTNFDQPYKFRNMNNISDLKRISFYSDEDEIHLNVPDYLDAIGRSGVVSSSAAKTFGDLLNGLLKVLKDASPNKLYREHWAEYSRYVQSLTRVIVRKDGHVSITTKFSNGHRTRPFTLAVSIGLISKDGKLIHSASQDAHLLPSFGGSARERIVRHESMISIEAVNNLSDTKFSYFITIKEQKEWYDNLILKTPPFEF